MIRHRLTPQRHEPPSREDDFVALLVLFTLIGALALAVYYF